AFHWRGLRHRSAFCDSPSRLLQAAQEAHFQDGAAAPPLRTYWVVGIKDHHPLLDRLADLCPLRAHHAQVAVKAVARTPRPRTATQQCPLFPQSHPSRIAPLSWHNEFAWN